MATCSIRLTLSVAVVAVYFFAPIAQAMIAPIPLSPDRASAPMIDGVLIGGMAGEEFTLLKVKVASGWGGSEKWTLVYGDRMGKPVERQPGYFQVAVDRTSKRVVIDLAQVFKTAVDNGQLAKLVKTSNFVATADMAMDPQDRSTNITMTLKKAATVKVESSTDSGEGGGVVLQLVPVKGKQ